MKSISKETREIIISANERGEKPRTISIWTKVCLSSVYNIIAMHKKTNSIVPKPHIGRPSKITKEIEIKIRGKIKEKNDITLEELIEELDLPIKKSQLSKLLISWDLSFKKRHFIPLDNNVRTSKKNVKIGKKNRKA